MAEPTTAGGPPLALHVVNGSPKVAYFSMEIGLDAAMPTYAGGLGVLAGDTIRSAADLRVPMVAMTLVHRKGYFHQRLDPGGVQHDEPADWEVPAFLTEMPVRASVVIEQRVVQLRAWRYAVTGVGGFRVPVYFLDADLPENSAFDRTLTHYLYGGDAYYRLCQEMVLGIGGVRMLRALGYARIDHFHMNEGHASLLALELLDEEVSHSGGTAIGSKEIELVRQRCVFTTHTPVAAGHDQYPMALIDRVIGHRAVREMNDIFCCEGVLNMTFLALNLSHYINGVAKKHGQVTQLMYARYSIDAITNGVHAATWTAEPFQMLYDTHIPGWRHDNFTLRYALSIPRAEIWQAHTAAKARLLDYVLRQTGVQMDAHVLTLGFARRAATYKRADLLFGDIERLRSIVAKAGAFQVIYAGKAHPQDYGGKELIKRVFHARDALSPDIKIVYLENYDIEIGKLMSAGADVWLNTPQPPLEASGTSGMKAALNGVPSFSILDGWWIEGHIEGVTGWSIGENGHGRNVLQDRSADVMALYEKLERVILPLFYGDRDHFIEVMRHCIALNGSFFNTHRMIQQYVLNAYFL